MRDTAGSGDETAVRIVLEAGADDNARDTWGGTPLIVAANNGYFDIANLLVSKGTDVNARESDGKSALISCFETGGDDWKLVQLLLKHGADFNVRCADGDTALSAATKNNSSECIRLLKRAGATK